MLSAENILKVMSSPFVLHIKSVRECECVTVIYQIFVSLSAWCFNAVITGTGFIKLCQTGTVPV